MLVNSFKQRASRVFRKFHISKAKYILGIIFKLFIAYGVISYLRVRFSVSWQSFLEYSPPKDQNVIKRKKHFHRGSKFVSMNTAKVDSSMEEIAFFLQIQSKSLPLLPRLFNRIYHPDNVYIVHFDSDVSEENGLKWLLQSNVSSYSTSSSGIRRNDSDDSSYMDQIPANVRIIESETVNYIGISMTLNTINGLQEALDFSSKWRYFINLSGNDYPLLSADTIRTLLSHKGQSREFFCFEPMKRRFWNRFSYMYFDPALDLQNLKKPVSEGWLPNPLAFFSKQYILKAEAWMIISRPFANFIVKSSFARRVLLLFSYSLMAEEMYFVTVARNTLFSTLTAKSCMRKIMWHDGDKWSGQHPVYLDDLYDKKGDNWWVSNELRNTTAFFARKFRQENSSYMDYIDEHRNATETISRVSNYFYNDLNI